MIHLNFPTYLNTIILYTISDPDTSKKIVELLKKIDFTQEGDQSTLMRSTKFKKVDATNFKEAINKVAKGFKFSNNDSFTLLVPEYESKFPVIARYRFEYNEKSKSFTLSNT